MSPKLITYEQVDTYYQRAYAKESCSHFGDLRFHAAGKCAANWCELVVMVSIAMDRANNAWNSRQSIVESNV